MYPYSSLNCSLPLLENHPLGISSAPSGMFSASSANGSFLRGGDRSISAEEALSQDCLFKVTQTSAALWRPVVADLGMAWDPQKWSVAHRGQNQAYPRQGPPSIRLTTTSDMGLPNRGFASIVSTMPSETWSCGLGSFG